MKKLTWLFSIAFFLTILSGNVFAEPYYGLGQVEPENESEVYNSKITFKWPFFKDDDHGAGKYSIRIATSKKFDKKDIVGTWWITTNQCTAGSEDSNIKLKYGNTYYWQVRPYGKRTWKDKHSPIVSFTLKFQTPDRIFPEKGRTVNSQEPSFRFSIVDAAQTYEVEIAEDPEFNRIIETIKNEANSSVFFYSKFNVIRQPGLDGQLETDDDYRYVEVDSNHVYKVQSAYFWRVRSVYLDHLLGSSKGNYKYSELGKSVWSESQSFHVPAQPGGEQLQRTQQVTKSQGFHERCPQINAQNDKLLYIKYPLATQKLYDSSEIWLRKMSYSNKVISVSEGEQPIVTSVANSGSIYPSWFPDGKKIAFASNSMTKDQWDVIVKSIDSQAKRLVTDNPEQNWRQDVSPDGVLIVYDEYNDDNECYIWLVQKGGTSRTQLVRGFAPNFSPNGSRIAYSRWGNQGNIDLWIINTDGTGNTRITESQPYVKNQFPSWHPSGKLIVYSSTKSGNWDIWLISDDGTKKNQLTTYLGSDSWSSWAFNGEYIFFSSTRNNDTQDIWLAFVPMGLIGKTSGTGSTGSSGGSDDLW